MERVKNAMQRAIWKFNERIFHHLKAIGRFTTVGYGSLLDVLQSEAQHDEECRRIIRDVNDQYAAYLRESVESTASSAQSSSSSVCSLPSPRILPTSSYAPKIRIERECRRY